MGCFMILWSCGCCMCAQSEYVTTIDTNPLNIPSRAGTDPKSWPKSWQCGWEGPLWFSHPASYQNQVGPSGYVPRSHHEMKPLKATQVNLYDHNHTCAVGQAPNAASLLTTVQPGRWTRVCCISFLDRVSPQGKPEWVEWVVGTKAVTQRNTGVCRGTRTSVHIMRNHSAPHSSSSSTPWRIGVPWITNPSLAVLTRPGPPVPSVSYSHIPGTIPVAQFSSKPRELPLLPGWKAEETSV